MFNDDRDTVFINTTHKHYARNNVVCLVHLPEAFATTCVACSMQLQTNCTFGVVVYSVVREYLLKFVEA